METKFPKTNNPYAPVFGSDPEMRVAPKFTMPAESMPEDTAYQIVHDEAMLDGNSRLNLATFVTTWMDDSARKIMTENMDKNMIDKTEYPQTAEIERRCVNILADLWHSPEAKKGTYCMGTSTVGSSEACMLGGLSALKRWQERRRAKGLPTDKPNFVISSCMQVVWEKFAIYWNVEMRMVPVTMNKITMDADDAIAMCDENTICIVPIEGVTLTGLNDNVATLDAALDKLNAKTGWEICIHVDAATGGFILPFLNPEQKWDFRLKWVLSISVSGHKFGLVYPGVGWIVWRDKKYLPKEMNFAVNYLGDEVPSISINFSRPGNQVLAQYYQFVRLGKRGYHDVQANSVSICIYLREELRKMGIFEFFADEMPNPLFIWKLKDDPKRKWTLYDLSDALHVEGWQVPAYTLPDALTETIVMRIVARQGTSVDLANLLLEDIRRCVAVLEKSEHPTHSLIEWNKLHKNQQRISNHAK